MKKLFLLLSLVVVFMAAFSGFTGCDDNKDDGTNKKNGKGGSKSPITFKVFIADINLNNDGFKSPVAQEIKKRTGVTLEVENAVSSDAGKQRVSIMAASGDYPDFVYAKGNRNTLKDSGALVKLDNYIDKYGPNIKKFYGDQYSRLKWSLEDPYIYTFGGALFGQENMEPSNGFLLQHAVVKELGYPKMKTLQDFEDAIKKYKEKYPKIDGQETIGYSILAEDWRAMISLTNPACLANGGSDDGEWYVDQNTFTIKRHLIRDEEKAYFKWLNHMYNDDLLDKESFTQKYDQYKAKIASGRVLGLSDARWEVEEAIKVLISENKLDRAYGYYPLTLNEGTKYAEFMDTGFAGGWGMSITKKCSDIRRAVEFFNWMAAEDAQILINWGIEGKHYSIKNGKRVQLPDVLKAQQTDPKFPFNTGIGNYTYPYLAFGNSKISSNGQSYSPNKTKEAIVANQTEIENEILKHYNVSCWKDLYPQKSEFNVKPYGAMYMIGMDDTNIKAKEEKILQAGYKMIPQAIIAKPDEFDAKYDEYIKEIKKIGLDEVTRAYQKALKDRLTLWGKK